MHFMAFVEYTVKSLIQAAHVTFYVQKHIAALTMCYNPGLVRDKPQEAPVSVKLIYCWSLRCSWSIACRRCSNYIFILNLTPGFNKLHKDNCKTRRETFKFLVRFILEIWRYVTKASFVGTMVSPWSTGSVCIRDPDAGHYRASRCPSTSRC